MKHLIWIAVVYTACNSTASTDPESNKATSALTEAKADTGPVACNKLVYFQPGAEINTKSYDGAGKELGTQHVKVLDIKKEGGKTIAHVTASDTSRPGNHITNMTYSYSCDGKSVFFDLASMMQATADKQNATFEASLIEYPIAISAGQTLPEASGTMRMGKDGRITTMTYHYKDRKVDNKEVVTTPAGNYTCYKISHRIEMEIDMPGMTDKAKKMMEAMTSKMKTTSITWFAPDLGIVKMEMYQNGQLQMKSMVVSVKK